MKKKVIILCTGNSCRSQMAEGYLRYFGKNKFEVVSAGLELGKVHAKAIQVMHEDGVDISQHTSKDVQQFTGQQFDYIITVCDNANEHCPYFPGKAQRIHWSFEDPAKATGTEAEILAKFRQVRDEIKEKMRSLVVTTQVDRL